MAGKGVSAFHGLSTLRVEERKKEVAAQGGPKQSSAMQEYLKRYADGGAGTDGAEAKKKKKKKPSSAAPAGGAIKIVDQDVLGESQRRKPPPALASAAGGKAGPGPSVYDDDDDEQEDDDCELKLTTVGRGQGGQVAGLRTQARHAVPCARARVLAVKPVIANPEEAKLLLRQTKKASPGALCRSRPCSWRSRNVKGTRKRSRVPAGPGVLQARGGRQRLGQRGRAAAAEAGQRERQARQPRRITAAEAGPP